MCVNFCAHAPPLPLSLPAPPGPCTVCTVGASAAGRATAQHAHCPWRAHAARLQVGRTPSPALPSSRPGPGNRFWVLPTRRPRPSGWTDAAQCLPARASPCRLACPLISPGCAQIYPSLSLPRLDSWVGGASTADTLSASRTLHNSLICPPSLGSVRSLACHVSPCHLLPWPLTWAP